jgi:cytochrome c5
MQSASSWTLPAVAILLVAQVACGDGSHPRLAQPEGPPAELVAAATAEEQRAVARLPNGPGRDLIVADCLICHSATMVEQQHKDSAAWNKTVTQMMVWGAPVPVAQKAVLLDYLVEHYGARTAGLPPQ